MICHIIMIFLLWGIAEELDIIRKALEKRK